MDEESSELEPPFEDILRVPDRIVRRALLELDPGVVALALKTGTPELKSKFFRNMPGPAAQSLREEMELMGPVRLADVEEAQHTVAGVVFLHEAEDGADHA